MKICILLTADCVKLTLTTRCPCLVFHLQLRLSCSKLHLSVVKVEACPGLFLSFDGKIDVTLGRRRPLASLQPLSVGCLASVSFFLGFFLREREKAAHFLGARRKTFISTR